MKEVIFPKGITGLILRSFVPQYKNIENEKIRSQYGILEGWVSVVVNLALALVKAVIGLHISSHALLADAVHSLSDVGTSGVVIMGFKLSQKPPDREHPFGYANAELVAALIMSVLLIIAGFELLRSYVYDLAAESITVPTLDWIMILIVVLTIIVKEWLGQFSKSLGKTIGSTALEADSWHHRLDAITTVLVIIGIIGSGFGLPWLDKATGGLVSLFIIWSGVAFAKESISPLLGKNVSQECIAEIRSLAMQDPLVTYVHDVVVHRYGRKNFISLHVEAPSTMSIYEMHDLAASVGERITERFTGECNVHMDPIDKESARYKEVAAVLEDLIQAKPELIEFHDLHFREEGDQEIILCELSVDPVRKHDTYDQLHEELKFYLNNIFKNSILKISLEPGYNV